MVVTDFDHNCKFPDQYLLWGSEPDDAEVVADSEDVASVQPPSFTAFADGVQKQVPKGAKKRLAIITQGLRDVFAVSANWFGAGGNDPDAPQEQAQPDVVGPPKPVNSVGADETCGTFAAQ